MAGAAAALAPSRVLGANDRVRLGFIGLGNRGDQVLDAFLAHPDAEVVAICDLWQPHLDFAAKKIGSGPKQLEDYRKLLDLKDVDAAGPRSSSRPGSPPASPASPPSRPTPASAFPPPTSRGRLGSPGLFRITDGAMDTSTLTGPGLGAV